MNGRVLYAILAVGASAAVSAACGDTSVTEVTSPDTVRCDVALAAESASVPPSGTKLTVGVSTQRDCTWSAQSTASWIQVSPTSGQGEASLTVNVAANTGQSTRSGNVTIGGAVYQVTQEGVAVPPHCVFVLVPASRTINDRGGSRDVRLFTQADCPWTATSRVSWIAITSNTSGRGSAVVRYEVERNRSDDDRVGTIVIGGETHTVRQDGD